MSNAAPASPADQLDDALLQRAWRLQRPPSWPATYAESMADPLRARLVQMFARQLMHSDAKAAARERWPATALTTPAVALERRRASPPQRAPEVDRKRAAAGDRDDD